MKTSIKRGSLISTFAFLLQVPVFATVTVHFENNTNKKGIMWTVLGSCSNGAMNWVDSPTLNPGQSANVTAGNGAKNRVESSALGPGESASVTSSCPVQISKYNNDATYCLRQDGNNKCCIVMPNDVLTIVNNGYTRVQVTATPGKPCKIERQFFK